MTEPRPDEGPFPLGVGSFDPLQDRVLIWTYLAGQERCEWEVAADDRFDDVVARGEATPVEHTGTVTVDVYGLEPGTHYWYRFRAADGATSQVGRTRTLPGDDARRLRLAAVCCARFGQSELHAYRTVAEADVDLVVHLGDYIYEDTKADLDDRAPEPDHDCVTLDDYRARHAQVRRDADAQALHAAHPMVVIWDDHDLADNAWRGGAKTHDPKEHGPWPDRMQAALRAQQDFLPKRLADPDDLTSAWRRLDAGDLCTFVATEGRAHRDEPAGAEGSPPADDPARTMLGATQARWVEDVLIGTRSRWVVLLSGTVMSELVLSAPAALDGVLPEKYAVVDGHATNTDQWDGYLVERRRLAAALGRRAGNLVLSGDIHSGWAIEGPLDAHGVPVAVELVCPPAATTPMGQLFPPGVAATVAPRLVQQIPGGRWAGLDHRGYLIVELSEDRAEAEWWWIGDDEDQQSGSPEAMLGRRWLVPRTSPAGLIDPEPRVDQDGNLRTPAPDDVEPPRHRLRRALTVAAGGAAAARGARWAWRRLRPDAPT